MSKTMPIRLPFGVQLATCHGLPLLVVGAIVAMICLMMVGVVSRLVPPVTLTAIWLEPREITTDQIRNKFPIKMAKSGFWTRLCPSDASETYLDDHGNEMLRSTMPHKIDVPATLGAIEHAPRPVTLPPLLAGAPPGHYKMRVDVRSACWKWENLLPIPSTSAEASFDIVADK